MSETLSWRERLTQDPGLVPDVFADTDYTVWDVRPSSGDYQCETDECPRASVLEFKSHPDSPDGGGGPELCAECAAVFYLWLIGKGPKP